MTLDKTILRELAVSIDVIGYLRIMDAMHRATPTGIGYGKTRFASPTDSFKLLPARRNDCELDEDRPFGRQKES